jgi:hypothetical protein
MAALLRQLQISIELAAESVRMLPGPTGRLLIRCRSARGRIGMR